MSIHELVDNAVACIHCGTPKARACSCWVRLECPDCLKSRTVRRDDSDPAEAVCVVYACPGCRDTEPEDVRYFDHNGNEVHDH